MAAARPVPTPARAAKSKARPKPAPSAPKGSKGDGVENPEVVVPPKPGRKSRKEKPPPEIEQPVVELSKPKKEKKVTKPPPASQASAHSQPLKRLRRLRLKTSEKDAQHASPSKDQLSEVWVGLDWVYIYRSLSLVFLGDLPHSFVSDSNE